MRFRLHLSAVVFALYFLVIPCDYHCNETSFSNVVGAELTDVEGPLVDDSIPTKADELDVHSSSDQPRVLDINITDVNPKLLKNNDDWWKMLAASMVSFLCSFLIFRLSMKKSNLDGLRAQLADVLKIAVQYPQLESEGFTSKWSQFKDTDNEHYIRYDNYCNLVFNLWELICIHFKYDEKKINEFINLKDWAKLHKDCWHNPACPNENEDSYSPKLNALIAKYTQE